MGIFDKFKLGFKKSASTFTSGLRNIIIKKEIDDKTLDQIEEYLIQSDVGLAAALEIKNIISQEKIDPKQDMMNEINIILKNYIISLMKPLENENFFNKNDKLNVVLVSGVNGVGKTTTIGKIGKILKSNGSKVMFSACDTFRAAAIEQLESWAKKIDVEIIKSAQGSDPASVAYEALTRSMNEQVDLLLIDTAGRLQNKTNLMEELAKIIRVIQKIDETAPHDIVIVLDATTGQNAVSQVKVFKEIVNVTGIIINKLDGTAKGGIIVSLSEHFGLPIYGVGVGEKITDLMPFNATLFAKNLVGIS